MHARVTPFGEVRVLLVEDEPLILLDCEAILASLGVGHVQSATSVPEAKALLEAGHAFDVAILDISLARHRASNWQASSAASRCPRVS